jgi:hypothetical protein
MPTIINASTSQGLVMTSDLSGQLAFQNNGTSLPMGGVAPAFSAYASASQSIATSTFTKIQINTKTFDTNTNFDATTNYRFTPTVAGYYQVSAAWYSSVALGQVTANIYKNGSTYQSTATAGSTVGVVLPVTSILYLNGSTDYIEFYVYQSSGSPYSTLASRSDLNYFQACLVRGTP